MEKREEMEKLAEGGEDERWLAMMLMKEIKMIAGLILERKEEEKEFWRVEIEKRKINIKKLDKRDGELLLDDDDDDLDDDVDDFDY